jgi:tripartite-type tricarboxylate transporter receptor subunit TctC
MRRFLTSFSLLFCAATPLLAQSAFPARPITMVVPFPAGGALDIVARNLAKEMTPLMGQAVIVENRAGAAGTIGSAMVAKAPADGYTLLFGSLATHGLGPALYPKIQYDALKDFAPITQVTSAPLVFALSATLPPSSVSQLVALAKSKPGTLNFASTGVGTADHLASTLFASATGINVVHVPYKGGGEAKTALMTGESAFSITNVQLALPQIKDGKLKALAVTGPRRVAALPDTPTLSEAGIAGVEVTTWFGLFAPANTPADVVSKLNREAVTAIRNLRERLLAQGDEPVGSTPAQFSEFIRAEHAKWGKVVRDANIRLD